MLIALALCVSIRFYLTLLWILHFLLCDLRLHLDPLKWLERKHSTWCRYYFHNKMRCTLVNIKITGCMFFKSLREPIHDYHWKKQICFFIANGAVRMACKINGVKTALSVSHFSKTAISKAQIIFEVPSPLSVSRVWVSPLWTEI